ncbi:MAG TPA: xanthine dehydrogenase family protein molybdopterin-binding subunit [Acidimicrobiia bacterium]|jgi:carbon-monoxide dehydrogenase large subunit|nr:xanthine dehydrogenase family protein molybdopterin-binding subunit [Acidimicrobiia bacterium]
MTITNEPRLVGARVVRVEDPRFLTGKGRYIANHVLPGMRHARFVRSPFAHARITGIDLSGLPEGVAAFTGQDWAEYSIEGTSRYEGFQAAPMPILAVDKVRFVGEPVVMVVADDPYTAEDAAETVLVDYEPLPAVTSVEQALREDAPLIHEDWTSNLFVPRAYQSPGYESEKAAGPLSVQGRFINGRHSGVPLENRAVLAEVRDDEIVVRTATQIPHLVKTAIANAMKVPENTVRVISPDVGGGFGVKAQAYPEEVACALASRALGVPVKWLEDRREHFLASHHARDHVHDASLHFTEEGRITALTATVHTDMGAYSVFPWTATMDTGMAMGILPGPYKFTGYKVEGYPTCTNKVPFGAYRGVARPAACFTIERLVDWMARDRGIDRLEARRMNLVQPEDFPWNSAGGLVYDGGSLVESIDVMKEWIDYDGLVARQAEQRKQGRLVGLGMAIFTEQSAHATEEFSKRGVPIVFGYETATLRLDSTGHLTIAASIHSHGQGLETTLAQFAGEVLGLPLDRVKVVFGDTNQVAYGSGTFASRSAVLAGGAARLAAVDIRRKLEKIAAHLLEASEEDLIFTEEGVSVKGSPQSNVTMAELCRITYQRPDLLPEGVTPTLEASRTYDAPPGQGTFTNALHVGTVEVDPGTGQVTLDNYWVVEDCGVMINPLIVEGQIHGGVAQGIGTAMFEEMIYDEDGQLLTTTFMDYLLPTAKDVPYIGTKHLETPSPSTEGGLKGMGEGGAIAPGAVVAGAVEDALSELGRVWVSQIPLTPERVLRYIHEAKENG